jgi:peroxiredoxin
MRKTLILTLCAALAVCFAPICSASPAIGSRAPDFELSSFDGRTFALSRELFGHKAVVVMFIATRCPYSNAYNARMAAYAKEYAARGVAFVGINSNVTESAQEVARHAERHGFTFPVVKDPQTRVADAYGARHTPEVYVIDPGGILRYHGRIDDAYEDPGNPKEIPSPDLRNALDALLAGRPIARTETKAFGCSIKRP